MVQRLKTAVLFAVLFAFSVQAQMKPKEIDQLVTQSLKTFHVAGAAVGIVKDGKIIHAQGYGFKNIQTQEKVDAHTNFGIASNSKAFTATALAILQEQGKLSWHDKVVDIIPEFKMYDAWVTAHFTIQDLLTHRSGLGLGAGDLMIWPAGSDFTVHDILTGFQYFEPVSEFRTKYDYDNLLYIVAGEVVKRVSGMRWEDFVQTHILDALGMDQSYASLALMKDVSSNATPYYTEAGQLKETVAENFDPDKINGAMGAIVSNVEDMCQWLKVWLNEGKYGKGLEKTLFSKQNHREMWRIHTVLRARSDDRYKSHFAGYGLGWALSDLNGVMSVSHTGFVAGMLSKTQMIPDLNLGIVVLTNTYAGGGALFNVITQSVVDSYLGLEKQDWIDFYANRAQHSGSHADSVVTAVWNTVEAAKSENQNLEPYVGTYKDAWFGQVDISLKDGQLFFQSQRSPKLGGPMYFYKANTFAIAWTRRDMEADAFALFTLDEEGKAIGIKMKGISPNIDFSYDFHDLDLKRVE